MESPFSIDGLSTQPVAHASPQSICIAPQGGPFSKQSDTCFCPAEATSTATRLWWLFKPRQRDTTVLKPVLLWQNKQSLGEGHGFYGGSNSRRPFGTTKAYARPIPPTPTRNSCSLVIDTRHRQNLHPMVRNNGSSFGRTTLTLETLGKKQDPFGGDIGHYMGGGWKTKALLGHVRINEIVLQTLFPWLLAHFSIRKDVARQQKVRGFFFGHLQRITFWKALGGNCSR